MLVIVPNHVSDAINAKLDEALKDAPEEAKAGREQYFSYLLAYYDEYGVIPDFGIVKL